ncbi:lysophosphatidylcholine acyltransferase NDAI_0B05760 [Naumovozyma dairenensis CBS 421]|uniref:Tafazzin family protein n=1 Tax=Naumovozyma dairenensis (strain ATCC 10597 / BCRC 20456 / CBS 421 / NBRC 0211 / NRRL Y-12639) TaxID=1071378 RepID=G0W748_NAUDC|nr:hypothetical protein NDAI_0B05760 [Naumovozyma dairenensis CBS 421]CCD23609.1 hypothetical protein NDAI_0B05760 [Naumovozyma dairenensis CBS 421]
MSFPDVLRNGDDFLKQYPRQSRIWTILSYGTSLITVSLSKLFLHTFYSIKVNNFEVLEKAVQTAENENRGIMTMMNHMSMVDDPTFWAAFPLRLYRQKENIRWCLGAENICFQNKFLGYMFSLGQVLSTKRFGVGPFQGSIDAAIRLLSPDDSLESLTWRPSKGINESLKQQQNSSSLTNPPIRRNKPSWVHVYPEGFVLQLHPPYSNSMRYFKWGITRMILESTKPPVIVPIFTTGFENIISEESEESFLKQLWKSFGTEINITIGDPLDNKLIDNFRNEWNQLVEKYFDPENPTNLSTRLKYGEEAQDLRSRVAAELRNHVAKIRHDVRNLPKEDPRFQSPAWWKKYTSSEGKSDPDVKFIGKNWAIKRLQNILNIEPAMDNNNNGDETRNKRETSSNKPDIKKD